MLSNFRHITTRNARFEIFKIEFFFVISPQEPHGGSLEKTNQSPVPDHPCYSRTKKLSAILKNPYLRHWTIPKKNDIINWQLLFKFDCIQKKARQPLISFQRYWQFLILDYFGHISICLTIPDKNDKVNSQLPSTSDFMHSKY